MRMNRLCLAAILAGSIIAAGAHAQDAKKPELAPESGEGMPLIDNGDLGVPPEETPPPPAPPAPPTEDPKPTPPEEKTPPAQDGGGN